MKNINAFPDGSAVLKKGVGKGDGGWGFCITDDIKSRRTLHSDGGYADQTTHNRMELTALINCLIYIYNNHTNITQVTLYCDSRYVIEPIYYRWLQDWEKNGYIKSDGKETANADLWKQILTLLRNFQRRGIKVYPCWVKGHSGNYFNELADNIAKESRISRTKNELYRN